jgi:hypothetical protein
MLHNGHTTQSHSILAMDIPCLTFTLYKSQDIFLPHGPFHVPNESSRGVIQEFYADLCDTSPRASAANDLESKSTHKVSDFNHKDKNITLITRASFTGAFESCFDIVRNCVDAIRGN